MEGLFSPMHLLIVGLIVLIIFGPKRLPELGRSLGSGLREFEHGTDEIHDKADDEEPPSVPVTQVQAEVPQAVSPPPSPPAASAPQTADSQSSQD